MSAARILISPSLLSADLLRLGDEVKDVCAAGCDLVHVDVMDGHFVPNLTFGLPLIRVLKKVSSVPVDVHLMVSNPDQVVNDYLDAGSDILTFHVEASIHAHRTIELIHSKGRKAGISLNPGTNIEAIFPLLEYCDLVLVMSVNPGFGGQKFIENSLKRVTAIRRQLQQIGRSDSVILQVDGGVTKENAKTIAMAGATSLVAGTAVFGEINRRAAIDNLR